MNLTWNPPLLLPGRHPYYEWNCATKSIYPRMRGKTENTYTVLTNVEPGILSCTVQAAMKTKRHIDNYGAMSSPVKLHVVPAGKRHVPSRLAHKIRKTSFQSHLAACELIPSTKLGSIGRCVWLVGWVQGGRENTESINTKIIIICCSRLKQPVFL